jgi:hypothetical protein
VQNPGVQNPGSSISILRILDASGDTRVSWDRDGVSAGDTEAQAAVREAERIFDKARASGAQAFRIRPQGDVERIERFDPQAVETFLLPPMVGG